MGLERPDFNLTLFFWGAGHSHYPVRSFHQLLWVGANTASSRSLRCASSMPTSPPLRLSTCQIPGTSSTRIAPSVSRTETLRSLPSCDKLAALPPSSSSPETAPLPLALSPVSTPSALFPSLAGNTAFDDCTANIPLPAPDTADTDSRASDSLPHTPASLRPDIATCCSLCPR